MKPALTALLAVFMIAVGTVAATTTITSAGPQKPPEWCAKHVGNPNCPSATPTPTNTQTSTPTNTPPTSTPPPSTCSTRTIINEGAARSFGEYLIHNNNWNDNYGGTHVISACSEDDWWVDVNVPNHSDNAVEAYPNVHKDYDDASVAPIISADFAGVGPKCTGCIYNVAFDIWIGSGFTHELMIWTENWGQRPAGSQIATVTIGGHSYQVWRSGSGDGGILTYVSTPEQLSGNMPLALFFADARTRGWTVNTTWQVDFGVETVDTNGTTQRFTFTDFEIYD